MKEASFYTKLSGNRTKCVLCPHNCTISEGNRGICNVRINSGGVLYTEVYGKLIAMHTDPIEKKPLYHYYPGTQVVSIGTVGCNLKCSFCQNCEISQASGEDQGFTITKEINEIVLLSLEKQKNIGLAYTYNEPVIFYEYMTDLASEVHRQGMKNIMVSNGFINPEPLSLLLDLIDAFNIDLKSFDQSFYRKYTHSDLEPVLKTIKTIAGSKSHLELTFLVIPGLNDDAGRFEEMTDWIVNETGKNTVLHISRYFPHYNMNIAPTPVKLLESLYKQARKKLNFVYIGNARETMFQDSHCPNCSSLLLKRSGYYTTNEGLDDEGKCNTCKEKVITYMRL